MSLRRVMMLRRQTLPLPPEPPQAVFLDEGHVFCSPELLGQMYALILGRKEKERRYWNIPLGGSLPLTVG